MKYLLLFIFFWAIYASSVARTYQGCKGNSEDRNQIRCGDKCGHECFCGHRSFDFTDSSSWCCTNDTCSVTVDERNKTLITCPTHSRQSLSLPCNGRCNHWIKDGSSRRSHVLCLSENQCANEGNMCHGDALCEDKSDLKICKNKTMWTGMSCPVQRTYTRCKGSIPGQCLSNGNFGDGEYNCNDRSDEKPHATRNKNAFNMTALIKCKTRFLGQQVIGLKCGEECVAYFSWCNSRGYIYNHICPELNNVSSTDKELCKNITFWETQECGYARDGSVGVRCTGGRSGECIYPNTVHTDFSRSCDDKSDQKHQINGICPPIDHARITLCNDTCRYRSVSECNKCYDPNNCKGSCDRPGPSCASCTNPFYFYCKRSGECVHPDLRCDLHPQYRYGEDEENCLEKYREKGLVPQHATYKCQSPHYHRNTKNTKKQSRDDSSGKELTVFLADNDRQYEEKGVVVEIVSVRCNQVKECYNNVDEKGCDNDISPIKILLALFCLSAASLALSICLRYFQKKSEDQGSHVECIEIEGTDENDIPLLDQIKQTDITKEDDLNRIKYIIEDKHSQSTSFEDINVSLLALQNMNVSQKFKNDFNSFYFGIEMKIHKGNKSETLVCMKQHLNSDIAEIILNDAEPESQVALLRWYKTKSTAAKDIVNKGGWILYFLKMTRKVVSLYLDMIKDIALTVSLLGIITFDTVIEYPTVFSCQIIWLLISSVLVPLITFGIQVASKTPYIIFGMEGQKKYQKNAMGAVKLLLLRILIVVFSFLVPALLIYIEERTIEDARNLIGKGKINKKTILKFEDKKKFAIDVSKVILEYKRNEFSFEIIIQITVQIVMLLMNYTKTKMTSGLEVIFEEKLQSAPTGTIDKLDYEIKKSLGTTNILVLSILWSFKTTVTTYNKIKSIEKGGFFPIKAKLVLGVRTLICTVTRVGCIVVYFTPFLGLFDLMAHWKSEQISFSPIKSIRPYGKINMNYDTFSCWNDDIQEVQHIPYSQLYRSDYHNGTRPPTPPSYISYTMVKLYMAYLIFGIIMVSQMILLLCSNMCFSQKFRAGTKTYKIRYILQTLHVPDIASDWDDIEGSVMAHRRQWRKTILEISIMILVQFMINLSLLWPIMVTGFKIKQRHEFIKPCIGVFPEEEVAYQRVSNFMWSLPVVVLISSLLDWLLIFIYQKICHPWNGILKDEQNVEDVEHPDLQTVDEHHDTSSEDSNMNQKLHTNVIVDDLGHPDFQTANEPILLEYKNLKEE